MKKELMSCSGGRKVEAQCVFLLTGIRLGIQSV